MILFFLYIFLCILFFHNRIEGSAGCGGVTVQSHRCYSNFNKPSRDDTGESVLLELGGGVLGAAASTLSAIPFMAARPLSYMERCAPLGPHGSALCTRQGRSGGAPDDNSGPVAMLSNYWEPLDTITGNPW